MAYGLKVCSCHPLNITLEVYNTHNYVKKLLQFECSVCMKIERILRFPTVW